MQKSLEEANIKLDTVICDLMGVSGRRMIEAMIAGERHPPRLAALAERTIKASPKQFYEALHGRLTEHDRFRLPRHLGQWDALDAAIRPIDQEVAARIARLDAKRTDAGPTFRELMVRLCGIPGGGCAVGDQHPGRDGSRQAALPNRLALGFLGWPLSRTERKCRQAEIGAPCARAPRG
jgi:hypothetical protein